MSTDNTWNGEPAEADAAAAEFDESFTDDDGVLYDEEVTPEYGILGFTLRELLIVGVWFIAFVVSFFPYLSDVSIWGTGIRWILPIGLPTVAVFLLVLRRFSPDGIRRVGSLGIDQFASVAFSVSAVFWLTELWNAIAFALAFDGFGLPWNAAVQLIAALALVVLTVFAPLVPGLKEDFHGRLVTLAHRNANPVRPVIARPRPEPATTDEAPAAHEGADAATIPAAGAVDSAAPATSPEWRVDEPTAAWRADEPTAVWGADEPVAEPATASTTPAVDPALDIELSGLEATDEVARLDVSSQVPLASHASGGGTGTEQTTSDEEYVPTYSRRTWSQEQEQEQDQKREQEPRPAQDPEIVSDTGSIESLLGARAQTYEEFAETSVISEIDEPTAEAATPVGADAQPFWVLAPTERDVHDERGEAIFRIGPSAWALVIEDRGGAYVVRHDDGRIGYLHDIADITKG